ncbi:hypothetical protein [Phenylobacterium aquaticum]|uniref:hypothetical protein n=1 Tax=Phenylobacterium aquaticum TaxID=1763816 RepID=UPI0026E9D55B|nr:hypothetical protein [Phenylobacterium aquaticum]
MTEIVVAVVVHSSAAAYSHFGVTLDAHQVEKPAPAERTVARSAAPKKIIKVSEPPMKSAQCLEPRLQPLKSLARSG